MMNTNTSGDFCFSLYFPPTIKKHYFIYLKLQAMITIQKSKMLSVLHRNRIFQPYIVSHCNTPKLNAPLSFYSVIIAYLIKSASASVWRVFWFCVSVFSASASLRRDHRWEHSWASTCPAFRISWGSSCFCEWPGSLELQAFWRPLSSYPCAAVV